MHVYYLYAIVYRCANMSELLKAVEEGNFQEVKRLIESGADVNRRNLYKNQRNVTALHTAVKFGFLEIVKYLLERSANINCKNEWGETVVHVAVESGSLEMVKYLVEHGGAKVAGEQCNRGNTVLSSACAHGNDLIVDYLLQHGAIEDINTQFGYSPLRVSCFRGHIAVVQTLLKYNVDIRKERVLECGNDQIMDILDHELKKSINHREKIKNLKTVGEDKLLKVICLRIICFKVTRCLCICFDTIFYRNRKRLPELRKSLPLSRFIRNFGALRYR